MSENALLIQQLWVGACLFGLGLVGFLSRRNLILMFLSVELMLQGVSLSFVSWGRFHGQLQGQVFALFVMAVAAAEAAVALALVLNLVRARYGLDVLKVQHLREDGLGEIPREVEEEEVPSPPPPSWPRLPRVGRAPVIPEEVLEYRPSV
ncbi:MAG: hypothetical protein KatS3mg112_0098 [Thermogutta sp.]|nr:MAG: hypothetical protein KatS3mg112_0098 [Thermogutta sp.]